MVSPPETLLVPLIPLGLFFFDPLEVSSPILFAPSLALPNVVMADSPASSPAKVRWFLYFTLPLKMLDVQRSILLSYDPLLSGLDPASTNPSPSSDYVGLSRR